MMKKIIHHSVSLFFVCLLLTNCSNSGSSTASQVSEIPDNTSTAVPPAETPAVSSPTTTTPPVSSPPVTTPPVSTPTTTPSNETSFIPLLKGDVQLIVTPNPNGHVEFIQSINKTKSGDTIRMAMFHITDSGVINALTSAQSRGVTVKVILDGASLSIPNFYLGSQRLKSGGIDVRPSTSAFTITHQKSMTINNSEAFITAINLTGLPETTRDFGLIVHDPAVISEVVQVFEQDWQNAATNQGVTPTLSDPHLLWSPVNSQTKLVSLIASAKNSLAINVENLGDSQIESAMIAAFKRGVSVRIIVPMCSKNIDPKLNYPSLKVLAAGGVQAKVMPEPETVQLPYMHSKMIVADGITAYVGSVNFSKNSTTKARELGILFSETKPIQQISNFFEQDWKVAIAVPDESTVSCSLL